MKIRIIIVLGAVIVCAGLISFTSANAQYREFIIEGRDRRPIRGSFEYHNIYPRKKRVDTGTFAPESILVEDEFKARAVPLARKPLADDFTAQEQEKVITGEPVEEGSYFSREYLYTILGFLLIAAIAG